MVLGFESEESKRFKKEVEMKHEENAIGLSEKLITQAGDQTSYEPQVSKRILETNTRLLDMEFSKDGRYARVATRDEGLREPVGDDALGFVTENQELQYIMFDIDTNLAGIRQTYHKYSEDKELTKWLQNEFNEISAVRQMLINDTRITGKPSKLAKSQYVQAETNISRQEVKGGSQQEQKKFINF